MLDEPFSLPKKRGFGLNIIFIVFAINVSVLLYVYISYYFDVFNKYFDIIDRIYTKFIVMTLFLAILVVLPAPFIRVFRKEIADLAQKRNSQGKKQIQEE